MDELLWDKEEAVRILWEMYRYQKPLKVLSECNSYSSHCSHLIVLLCRKMKREVDEEDYELPQHDDQENSETELLTKRTAQANVNASCSRGSLPLGKEFSQCKIPPEFTPRVCSTPLSSPIKHLPHVNNSPSYEQRGMQSKRPAQIMRKTKKPQTPLKPEKVPKLDFDNLVADNLRKVKSADHSDPDLQIIARRNGDIDEDVKVI